MNMTRMPGCSARHPAGQLDPVELGHHDVGEQQVEIDAVLASVERRRAVADRIDDMPGALQPARQESAHLIVVFGEEDARHSPRNAQDGAISI